MSRSALRAGLTVLVIALAPLLPTGRAVAAPTASVRLVSATAWVPTGGAYDLRLRVAGIDDLAAVDVSLTIFAKVTSRSQFAQTLEGRLLGRSVGQVTLPLAALATDGRDYLVSLPLPRADTPAGPTTLPALRMGVYPVTVTLRQHDGATLDRFVTQLVRLPDDSSLRGLSVAWIQPVGTRPVVEGGRALSDAERAAPGTAIDAVAANPGLPLTLAVSPESLEALDAAHVATLRDTLSENRQLLAMPYVDVDVRALITAGRAEDLASQRQTGDDAFQAALGTRGDTRTWSSEQALTAPALARLRDLGVAHVAIPESSLQPLPSNVTRGLTLTRPFDLSAGADQTLEATAVDAGLTAHFRSGRIPALAAHDLLADLAVLFFDTPGAPRGVAVRPPANWQPSRTFLDAVLPALASTPILQPVTLDGLFNTVEPVTSKGGTVLRLSDDSTRAGALPAAGLTAAHAALDDLAALIGPTSEPVADTRRRLLVAESRTLSASDRSVVLTSVTHSFDEVRGRVGLRDGRTFRLTARSGTIPLTLVNDNPFPVRVDLQLSSEKLEFTDASGPDRSRDVLRGIVLQPGTQTRTVPVRARASAAFSLRASLSVPDGQEIVRGRFTIISTVFSGVGVVLSAGAVLFLLLWWGSHWRTVRRGRRLVEMSPNP